MVGVLIGFAAALPLIVIAMVVSEGNPSAIWKIVVAIVWIGVATEFNRRRRRSVKGSAAQSPVVKSIPQSRSGSDNENQKSTAENKIPSQQSKMDCAGEMLDGQFVITEDELRAVRAAPSRFHNVFRFEHIDPTDPTSQTREKFYLILGHPNAIFIDQAGDEVWNVVPSGITVSAEPLSILNAQGVSLKVRSIDKRTETVQCPPIIVPCLKAWISSSYDEFRRQTTRWPDGWGLLAYELASNRNPESFLSWKLPYANIGDAVDKLSENQPALKAFSRAAIKLDRTTVHSMFNSLLKINTPKAIEMARALKESLRAFYKKLASLGTILAVVALIYSLWNLFPLNWDFTRLSVYQTTSIAAGVILFPMGAVTALVGSLKLAEVESEYPENQTSNDSSV